ncbi:hypothetical protein R3P38DRAFT_3244299 [Favolaschia claudopus]|uniref:Uncharacterized protein n=1 Tax=Favolaschia claudopus TaxID=2862362 RepID=A0AAV9Z1S3_9AGAR
MQDFRGDPLSIGTRTESPQPIGDDSEHWRRYPLLVSFQRSDPSRTLSSPLSVVSPAVYLLIPILTRLLASHDTLKVNDTDVDDVEVDVKVEATTSLRLKKIPLTRVYQLRTSPLRHESGLNQTLQPTTSQEQTLWETSPWDDIDDDDYVMASEYATSILKYPGKVSPNYMANQRHGRCARSFHGPSASVRRAQRKGLRRDELRPNPTRDAHRATRANATESKRPPAASWLSSLKPRAIPPLFLLTFLLFVLATSRRLLRCRQCPQRIPTSVYFARQERAFFAQAGKQIVRVWVDVDFGANGRAGYRGDRERAGKARR